MRATYFVTQYIPNLKDKYSRLALWIIGIGIAVRLGYWLIWPVVWKVFPAFLALEEGWIAYLIDFQGYTSERMPFFNVINSIIFLVAGGALGIKALTLFNVVISCLSLPLFHRAITRYFDEDVALASLTLFAFYPKYVVMSARGMPEAASVGFIAAMLFYLARSQESESLHHYALAGTFALCAYLMFIPAVAVGVIATGYIYVDRITGNWPLQSRTSVFPTLRTWVFALPSLLVGLLYLAFGPLSEGGGLIDSFGSSDTANFALFVDPEAYSLAEKIVRYTVYYLFDFWWHKRGFDQEQHIQSTFDLLASTFGDLFVPYLIGWFLITLSLTAVIILGFYNLFRQEDRLLGLFFTVWVGLFVVIINIRNIGWVGGFQTRHVFPVFPALCLAFGLGTVALYRATVLGSTWIPLSQRQAKTGLSVLIGLAFAVLLVNASVHGVLQRDITELSKNQPVNELEELMEDGDRVGVLNVVNFRDVILYSGGTIEPVYLDVNDRGEIIPQRIPTSLSDHTPPASEISHVYVVSACGSNPETERAFIRAIVDRGGSIVHERIHEGICRVEVTIVETP